MLISKRTQSLLLLGAVLLILGAVGAARGERLQPGPVEPRQAARDAELIASYEIDVRLDAEAKSLAGRETITYVNRTGEPIPDLVFHLYLNAFRDENSIFFQEGGLSHRSYTFDPEYPGWIDVSELRIVGGDELSLELLEDGTLARADLPEPVLPGEQVQIEVIFTAQLPKVFARTGFAGDFFMVGQWFPKLGVWEEGAWNAYPFHVNSEFYADFGIYDVSITVPGGFVTAGTGMPVETTENSDGTATVVYHAEPVIDFAWAASPDFMSQSRQVDGVEILYVYLPGHEWSVERVLDAAEAAVRGFGQWFGPYPYSRLTVVDVPDDGSGAGGMEYPTLITAGVMDMLGIGPLQQLEVDRTLELVTVHEVGHQWWQSMVAFNEAEEPWLDEGFTDYSAVRLMQQAYGEDTSALDLANIELSYLLQRRVEYLAFPVVPMYGKAWEFEGLAEYGVGTYSKPAMSLLTLEGVLGEQTMLEVMSTFFQRYQYGHPGTEEFRQVAEEVSGQSLDWFFDGLVYGDGVLNYAVTQVDEHSVQVVRQGDVRVPTQVRVTFADGGNVLETWDGVEPEQNFTYPDREVIQAEVDPERKIYVDLRWSDNGLARRAQISSWLALVTRLLYQVQNALLAMGGL